MPSFSRNRLDSEKSRLSLEYTIVLCLRPLALVLPHPVSRHATNNAEQHKSDVMDIDAKEILLEFSTTQFSDI